ncbi:MAG: 4'-phosphopantetheinyl transferase superfamily protein [Oscillospiraceae bacterium]|nr:4'-phosphopantetheinyl transferase superfamily protein [Oscillospiraceae bacterium]
MRLTICPIKPYMSLLGLELVTDARRKRIQAYMRPEDKARCLVAGLLLRKGCGVTDDEQLAVTENGKPTMKDGGQFFNLSHSGDYVVLATAGRQIGVDIEKITRFSEAVAARCFTPQERDWMQEQRTGEAFFQIWTAKESVMKAIGLGFSLPPQSFDVLPMDASAHVIAGKSWFLDWLTFDGHVICRALEGKAETTEIEHITQTML